MFYILLALSKNRNIQIEKKPIVFKQNPKYRSLYQSELFFPLSLSRSEMEEEERKRGRKEGKEGGNASLRPKEKEKKEEASRTEGSKKIFALLAKSARLKR